MNNFDIGTWKTIYISDMFRHQTFTNYNYSTNFFAIKLRFNKKFFTFIKIYILGG